MPPQLIEIKYLYKIAISLYKAALENCGHPNLYKFFQSYCHRRQKLLVNIYDLDFSGTEELLLESTNMLPFETIVHMLISNEEELIKAYKKVVHNLEDDKLQRSLRLHLTELEISYKNMLIIIPFYWKKKLTA